MSLYQGKYRVESTRMQTWDYGTCGAYFVTICTKDRIHFFGEIEDSRLQYSPAGSVADALWHEIPYHANNVELGEFVVMPNHIHGIIILTQKVGNEPVNDFGPTHVETTPALSLNDESQNPTKTDLKSIGKNRFQNQGKNTLSAIVGGYKSSVSRNLNRMGIPFGWQARFHDHIIRDYAAFERISDYIQNNPNSWREDKFNTQNRP